MMGILPVTYFRDKIVTKIHIILAHIYSFDEYFKAIKKPLSPRLSRLL